MTSSTGVFSTSNTTGNKILAGLGFQPSYIRFTLGQKTGTSETFVHQSEGSTDGTNQRCVSVYWDSTGGKSVEFTDRLINHINRVTGTLTDVIKATFVSFDADGFTINFNATTTGYHVHYEAFA